MFHVVLTGYSVVDTVVARACRIQLHLTAKWAVDTLRALNPYILNYVIVSKYVIMWTFFQGPVSFVRSSNQSALSDVLIRAFYCKNGQFFPFSSYDLKSDTLDLNSSKLKQAFFRTGKTCPLHFINNVSLKCVPVNVNFEDFTLRRSSTVWQRSPWNYVDSW